MSDSSLSIERVSKDGTITRECFQLLKKRIEPIKKLSMHDDADGITSAVLMSYIFDVKKVWAPDDFGVWPIKPYILNGKEEIPPDACVDMLPQNPLWQGLAIDHHPGHPPEDKRSYQLIHGEAPASVIIYTLFKNYIPQEQRWKVAVGAVGDGQPEIIPPDVWRENPVLLEETISLWKKYGKYAKGGPLEMSSYPIYFMLSSGINAACKIPEKWYLAYSVLRNAKSPWDLLNDSSLKASKGFLNDEKTRILSESHPIQLRSGIKIWGFTSETKIERTLAWELNEKDKKTIVAVNTQTGRGSIRGVLATLVYDHLTQNGYKASGHPGFGGIKLKADQTFEDLYACMAKLKL